MPSKLTLLAIVSVIFSKSLYAQTNNNRLELTPFESLKVFTPDNNSIQGTIYGAELAYHFNMTRDSLDYVRILHISAIDIVGSYRNLHSLTVNNDPALKGKLGDTYTLIGRFEIPLYQTGPVKLLFTPGFGFAYSSTSYFTNGNPLIGSRINFAAQAGMKIITAVSNSTGLQAGIDLLHYSNSGFRVPNHGINSINISFGIIQDMDSKGPATPEHPYNYPYKHSFEFGGDIGMRGVFESKKYLYRSGLYAGYNYQLNQVFSLKAGVDAGSYFTVYNPKNNNATFEGHATSYDRWRAGLSVGTDIALGKLAVMVGYGYYIHFNGYYPTKTYWTPGFKYYVLPWMAVQAKTYIHTNEADYLGLGLLFRVHP